MLRYPTLEYRSLPLAIELTCSRGMPSGDAELMMFAEMDAAAEAQRPPGLEKSLRNQVGCDS